MKVPVVIVAALIVGGCGAYAQPYATAPLNPAQQLAQGFPAPLQAPLGVRSSRQRSWMAPDAKHKQRLLYVADEATGDVNVYDYPNGKLEGTLTGFNAPSGMCTNKAGEVFILNGGGFTIDVYAHGGSVPIRTLELPGYPEFTCSVDPTTGNLGLGTFDGSCGECAGLIVVFADAQGTPTTYQPSGQIGFPGCGYDEHGNLYCNAYSSDDHKFLLFELPNGSTNVGQIAVSGSSSLKAGPVQWDGEYLAIGSGAVGTIYQIALSGSTGSVEGSTQLDGTGWVWQFWITKLGPQNRLRQGKRIVAPTYGGSNSEVGYWKYPAGGDATFAITGFAQPDGATISTLKEQ